MCKKVMALYLPAAIMVLFFAITFIIIPSTVSAAGDPKGDYIPDIPTNDPAHDEKAPPVSFVLKRPSALVSAGFPSFSADLSGASAADERTFTINDKWYLDVDINTPGWLYIYEYYPASNYLPGRWLAYKWRIEQSGVWKLGPFSAREGELEGRHVYRLWFYGNDQWAKADGIIAWNYQSVKIISFDVQPRTLLYSENVTISWDVAGTDNITITPLPVQVAARNGVIFLSYDQLKPLVSENNTVSFSISIIGKGGNEMIKRRLVTLEPKLKEQAETPLSPTPAEKLPAPQVFEDTGLKNTIYAICGLLLIAALISTAMLIVRKPFRRHAFEPVSNPSSLILPAQHPSTTDKTSARLTTMEALEIPLGSGSITVGRKDLARVFEPGQLALISRRHFRIMGEGEQYSIEDLSNANGTTVNDINIRGKGPLPLNDGDVIRLPGSVELHFHLHVSH